MNIDSIQNPEIDLSIVIPVYNSEKMLMQLYERLTAVLQSITGSYEIIMIDDCSHDSSWELLEKIHSGDNRLKIIQLMKNVGQHKAIMCGFNHVRGRYIITLDDDLQFPPEEIPKLVHALNEDSEIDAIFGIPQKRKHNFFKNISSEIFKRITSLISNKKRDLRITSFIIIKREIVDELLKKNLYFATIGSHLLSITLKAKNVIVDHKKRLEGSSQYTLSKLIKLSFDIIIYFSTFPLKIISIFGLFISLISFLGGLFILLRKIFWGITISGWTSLIVVNLFLFGIVLFLMGIIGVYLIRIIHIISNEPLYVIRRKKF